MTDARHVGRTYRTQPFQVTAESIREFLAVLGDTGEQAKDLVAPATYGMVYGFDAYLQLWQDPEV